MDSGQPAQQAQYRQLLDRLGKMISEMGTLLISHEQRLEPVLERSMPTPETPKKAPFTGACPLEDDLHNLCEAAETRLSALQHINNRIRL